MSLFKIVLSPTIAAKPSMSCRCAPSFVVRGSSAEVLASFVCEKDKEKRSAQKTKKETGREAPKARGEQTKP